MSRATVMVSLSRQRAAELLTRGPRRDLVEVAAECGAAIAYSGEPGGRGGWRRFAGPHVRQAVAVARSLVPGATVLADGEHTGIPLVAAAAVLRKRPAGVVMIGHLVTKPWKLLLLGAVTRLGIPGTLVVHSIEQEASVRGWLGKRWRVRLIPYQVDTDYWTGVSRETPGPEGRPMILAVGAENRDYGTLCRAVTDLDVDVVIASGSHWARHAAGAEQLPENVELISETLSFEALRDLYRRAAMVVVPLRDVTNQSGVTTILEAMSCSLPVVVTATRGQRECITGPLISGDTGLEAVPVAGRGPEATASAGPEVGVAVTGVYVVPGDDRGLRRAITLLTQRPEARRTIGSAARASAVENFGIDRFVATLSGEMRKLAAGSGETPC